VVGEQAKLLLPRISIQSAIRQASRLSTQETKSLLHFAEVRVQKCPYLCRERHSLVCPLRCSTSSAHTGGHGTRIQEGGSSALQIEHEEEGEITTFAVSWDTYSLCDCVDVCGRWYVWRGSGLSTQRGSEAERGRGVQLPVRKIHPMEAIECQPPFVEASRGLRD